MDLLETNIALNTSTTIKLEYQPREAQVTMRDHFENAVRTGKKFVLIDSPVGTGKSFGAVMMLDWFKRNYDPGATFDVLTNSKILQEQYTKDFEFMCSLWGKDGYFCENYNCSCTTGEKMAEAMKTSCSNCSYKVARENFFAGEVSLTNFHMFATYKMYAEAVWDRQRASRVLVIDEAHEFDNVFCDFVSSTISKRTLRRLGMDDNNAASIAEASSRCHTLEQYARVVSDILLPAMGDLTRKIKSEINDADTQERTKMYEQLEEIERASQKWKMFEDEFLSDPGNWALERSEVVDKKTNKTDIEVTVQPVWAHKYLKQVWDKYDHVILMSGTMLDPELFCWMNGIPADKRAYLSIPSPFPVENRPIYYMPVGKMNFQGKVQTFSNQKPWLRKVLTKHAKDKGIIHTVNYELAGWVTQQLGEARLIGHESNNRQEVLNNHCSHDNPTVLVSPSMINGVDLKDDLSRFQVILKVPYPNLKSERVKKRMDSRPAWYAWKTVADLVQSYGRSIRSMDDHAVTYIMDSCFGDVMKRSGYLIPKYVQEAIKTINL